MIDHDDLLSRARVKVVDDIPSRKAALQELAVLLSAETDETARDIYFRLQEREKEGSTALGEIPVAIPHCRSEKCETPSIAVLKSRNSQSVSFEDDDVRILVAMRFPDGDPDAALKILQLVVTVVESEGCLENLLGADSSESLFEIFEKEMVKQLQNQAR